ncbi:MAG: ribonuclease P protein component [Chitinophagaceae bacterium]
MSINDNIPPSFTFPKAEHLKSRKAIEQLFKTGRTIFVRPYKVFYQFVAEASTDNGQLLIDNSGQDAGGNLQSEICNKKIPLQAGFAVSTRNFKYATDRNRVKRIGREAYRLNKQELMDTLAVKKLQLQVFFVYTDKTLPIFTGTQAKMKACLDKLITIIQKKQV